MFPESKVTEIYCMADDFCKEFVLQQEKYICSYIELTLFNKGKRRDVALPMERT